MIEFIIGLFYVIIIANGVLYCITSFNQEYGYMQEVFNEEAEALAAEKAQNIAPQPMTNIDVMNDENDEIDLPSYLTKGLVYYIKARIAEDTGNIDGKEYFMREYKKILERHESGKIGGVRIIGPGSHAIR